MTGVEIIMFFTCRCFFMFFKKQSKNEKELPERLSRKHLVIGIVTVILVILIVAIMLVISFSMSADKTTSTTSSITTTTTTTTTTIGKLAGSSTMSCTGRAKIQYSDLGEFHEYSTNS
jgi:NADH:ubiquinone oxidoreductase subunit 5 (subunit L)/multisubunit Na+/H+ antiporter MnhA subunit